MFPLKWYNAKFDRSVSLAFRKNVTPNTEFGGKHIRAFECTIFECAHFDRDEISIFFREIKSLSEIFLYRFMQYYRCFCIKYMITECIHINYLHDITNKNIYKFEINSIKLFLFSQFYVKTYSKRMMNETKT